MPDPLNDFTFGLGCTGNANAEYSSAAVSPPPDPYGNLVTVRLPLLCNPDFTV